MLSEDASIFTTAGLINITATDDETAGPTVEFPVWGASPVASMGSMDGASV